MGVVVVVVTVRLDSMEGSPEELRVCQLSDMDSWRKCIASEGWIHK